MFRRRISDTPRDATLRSGVSPKTPGLPTECEHPRERRRPPVTSPRVDPPRARPRTRPKRKPHRANLTAHTTSSSPAPASPTRTPRPAAPLRHLSPGSAHADLAPGEPYVAQENLRHAAGRDPAERRVAENSCVAHRAREPHERWRPARDLASRRCNPRTPALTSQAQTSPRTHHRAPRRTYRRAAPGQRRKARPPRRAGLSR